MHVTSETYTTFADTILQTRYSHLLANKQHETWAQIALRVVYHIMGVGAKAYGIRLPVDMVDSMYEYICQRKFIPAGRILANTGRPYHQVSNCFLLRAEDTRAGWADLARKAMHMMMSGGGIGVDYSALRPKDSPLWRSGGTSSGPLNLMKAINSIGKAAISSGKRSGAVYASLKWDHADIFDFIDMKNHQDNGMDSTNVSVIFDDRWLSAWHKHDSHAIDVFQKTVHAALQYGDPGFQVDVHDSEESLRNACCEIVSSEDSDSCILGHVNLANIKDVTELADVVELATVFLLCCTAYTDSPTAQVQEIRQKNRRLGLGIMGLAEWYIQRGYRYGDINSTLTSWLQCYEQQSDVAAEYWSGVLDMPRPVAVRAIAPTGTTAIAGGQTTSGIEPVFAKAYKRTWHNGVRQEEIVIEPIVTKLYIQGYSWREIEDKVDTAYDLAYNVDRRLALQAYIQQFVDNAISSTVNVPSWDTFGVRHKERIEETVLSYLPKLRGLTIYPDGARGYQPLQQVDLGYALQNGSTLQESEQCRGGVCGI